MALFRRFSPPRGDLGRLWTGAHGRRPRRLVYPLVGLILAQVVPTALLGMRAAEDGLWPNWSWLRCEWSVDRSAYWMLVLATTAAFVLVGAYLGAQEDRLRRLAITDPLTGLNNRRYLGQRFRQETARCRRYQTTLSLMIVDLDWLKTINDNGGHVAGDRAIRAVAATLEQNLRTTDILARYAGDEFVALLPETSASKALELARRINGQVRQWRCGPDHGPLSVSIGVADLRAAGGFSASAEDLFAAADAALYSAKLAGRDSAMAAPGRRLALLG